MSTKMQVEWRRAKVLELLSKGDSQSEIAKILQVDISIISRDVYFLRQQAKHNIKRYIDERLPEEYEKCIVGLNTITNSLLVGLYYFFFRLVFYSIYFFTSLHFFYKPLFLNDCEYNTFIVLYYFDMIS